MLGKKEILESFNLKITSLQVAPDSEANVHQVPGPEAKLISKEKGENIPRYSVLPCHVFNSPDHEPCRKLNFIYQELGEENHQVTAAAGRCGMSNATLGDLG